MATASSSESPSEETQTNQEAMQQQDLPKETTTEEEILYKTKSIQFLGRTTPIILQNENGPCPLLAICNVLLLRNNLNLNPDCYEVSQERLMSLVVDRLIDSNSKVNVNKLASYLCLFFILSCGLNLCESFILLNGRTKMKDILRISNRTLLMQLIFFHALLLELMSILNSGG
jgi:hypothetical protein